MLWSPQVRRSRLTAKNENLYALFWFCRYRTLLYSDINYIVEERSDTTFFLSLSLSFSAFT